MVIVAGIGVRPSCAADELAILLADAACRAGETPTVLAVPWFRAGAAMTALARRLALLLVVIEDEPLRRVQPSCPTRSAAALAAHGIASVAEACALAAAGDGAVLLLSRIASANATCAIAAAATGSEETRA